MEPNGNPVFISDDGGAPTPGKKRSMDVQWTAPPTDPKVKDITILPPVSFIQLFRFSSPTDAGLIVLSVFCAVLAGICLPGELIVFCDYVNAVTVKDLSIAEFNALRCNGTTPTTKLVIGYDLFPIIMNAFIVSRSFYLSF